MSKLQKIFITLLLAISINTTSSAAGTIDAFMPPDHDDEKFESIDINACDKYGQTPLIRAVRKGSIPDIQTLINQKADPNKKDLKGFDPLWHAILHHRPDIVKFLTESGAYPNDKHPRFLEILQEEAFAELENDYYEDTHCNGEFPIGPDEFFDDSKIPVGELKE